MKQLSRSFLALFSTSFAISFLLLPIDVQAKESITVEAAAPAGEGNIYSRTTIDPDTGEIQSVEIATSQISYEYAKDSYSTLTVADLGINPVTNDPIRLLAAGSAAEAIPIRLISASGYKLESIGLPIDASANVPGLVVLEEDQDIPAQYIHRFSRANANNELFIPPTTYPCTLKIYTNEKHFADESLIPAYGKEPAAILSAREIMMGTGDGSNFTPFQNVTRAQAAVLLYRLYNCNPSYSWQNGATWYSDAQDFMEALHFMGEGSDFRPNENISREQLATILRRTDYLPQPANLEILNSYPDQARVSGYAREALAWAVETGLMGQGSSLEPQAPVTRVQMAAILNRYMYNVYASLFVPRARLVLSSPVNVYYVDDGDPNVYSDPGELEYLKNLALNLPAELSVHCKGLFLIEEDMYRVYYEAPFGGNNSAGFSYSLPMKSYIAIYAPGFPLAEYDHTIYHELAHLVDFAQGQGMNGFSSSQVFQQIYQASPYVLGSYGATSPAEYFAEAVAMYYLYPQELPERSLDLYNFINGIFHRY